MKLTEPITAAHLINAAKLGNCEADAVLNKGQSTKHSPFRLGSKCCPLLKEMNIIFLLPLTALVVVTRLLIKTAEKCPNRSLTSSLQPPQR